MGYIKNIEIKARCSSLDRIRNILISQNANFKGKDHQIDTYFKVPVGRLKIREGNIENFIIFYERDDKKGPKKSKVLLEELTEKNINSKKKLEEEFGILVIVNKEREIYFIDNVKFHLDKVKYLGNFVEIEAQSNGNIEEEQLRKQCEYYMHLFEINEMDLVEDSYSDMILPD